jgi:hypothetical protein
MHVTLSFMLEFGEPWGTALHGVMRRRCRARRGLESPKNELAGLPGRA